MSSRNFTGDNLELTCHFLEGKNKTLKYPSKSFGVDLLSQRSSVLAVTNEPPFLNSSKPQLKPLRLDISGFHQLLTPLLVFLSIVMHVRWTSYTEGRPLFNRPKWWARFLKHPPVMQTQPNPSASSFIFHLPIPRISLYPLPQPSLLFLFCEKMEFRHGSDTFPG